MKMGFNTLSCPSWDFKQIISSAQKYGLMGVEFRGYKRELNLYNLYEFSQGAKETRSMFDEAGVPITCFSSSIHLTNTAELSKSKEELANYLQLCDMFGTSKVRVFGGKLGSLSRLEAIDHIKRNLIDLSVMASNHQVQLLIETHDDWVHSTHILPILDDTDPNLVGILWDIHHTYRLGGESPRDTWNALGSRIINTHWKDSSLQPSAREGYEYCFMGKGDIPLQEAYVALRQGNYTGSYTLEWEKYWHPELPEPEEAFKDFVAYMEVLKANGRI